MNRQAAGTSTTAASSNGSVAGSPVKTARDLKRDRDWEGPGTVTLKGWVTDAGWKDVKVRNVEMKNQNEMETMLDKLQADLPEDKTVLIDWAKTRETWRAGAVRDHR